MVDGFAGVIVELPRVGEGYVLRETAAGSGNRLTEICSGSERLARTRLDGELPVKAWTPSSTLTPPASAFPHNTGRSP